MNQDKTIKMKNQIKDKSKSITKIMWLAIKTSKLDQIKHFPNQNWDSASDKHPLWTNRSGVFLLEVSL